MIVLKTALICAFTTSNGGGNPCMVIQSNQKKAQNVAFYSDLASKYHCEIALVDTQTLPEYASVCFFDPYGAVSFCGHGSLAAAWWLAKNGLVEQEICFDYGTERLKLTVDKRNNAVSYDDDVGPMMLVNIENRVTQIAAMLGLQDLQPSDVKLFIGGKVQRQKAILQFVSAKFLSDLQLNPAIRDQFCLEWQATGLYLYVQQNPVTICSRHFPFKNGYLEDMATANLAPTLANYLVGNHSEQELTIKQGGEKFNIAQLNIIAVENNKWRVQGNCLVRKEVNYY